MGDFNHICHEKKDAFLKGGGWLTEVFDIPQLHSHLHHHANIQWLGATQDYYTEITEKYHIDIAKKHTRPQTARNILSKCYAGHKDRRKSTFMVIIQSGIITVGKVKKKTTLQARLLARY
jgi:hypothetical protein